MPTFKDKPLLSDSENDYDDDENIEMKSNLSTELDTKSLLK